MKTMLFAAVAAVTMGAGAYAPAKSPLMTNKRRGHKRRGQTHENAILTLFS